MTARTKIPFTAALLLLLIVSFVTPALAQLDSLGIAIPTEIESDQVEEGDIICTKEGGNVLCDLPYDAALFGVVTATPAMAFRHDDDQNLPLVLQKGNTIVKVTSANGNIAVGDLVTSSDIPGVGQKADLNGYVLGMALEPYESDDTESIGDIYVSLNIHPLTSTITSRSNIVASLRQALSAPTVSPLASFRYLLAFLVALISFAIGFVYFGRVVKSGIDAIGRNPKASRTIQIAVFINIMVTIAIVLSGLGITFLILIL